MSQVMQFHTDARPVAQLDVDTRATFITKTYSHLLGAILAFTALEMLFFATGLADKLAPTIAKSFYVFLILFMVLGFVASRFAHNTKSKGMQYFGLFLYVGFEAIIFLPLLWIANTAFDGVIESAALITLAGFSALTGIAFYTRKDFSFLRSILMWGMGIAVLLIVASLIFSFSLGVVFMVAMIALAGGFILYDTSNVIHHFPEDRYVGASLQLFASVALMFWYVLMFAMSLAGSD